MAESGGTTTQSGIFFQNSITALFLGRLCDTSNRPADEQVVRVRAEAPEHVDDTVVEYADQHRKYIQAKENVQKGDRAWTKVWKDFENQYWSPTFQRNKDRLALYVGEVREEHSRLRELSKRAFGHANYADWWNGLADDHKALVAAIRKLLEPEHGSDEDVHAFFHHVEVQIAPLEDIEENHSPLWIPESNKEQWELFRLLRDRVGGNARYRMSFDAASLRAALADEADVQFQKPLDIDELSACVKVCGASLRQHRHTIGNTDFHLVRNEVATIVDWARQHDEEKNVAVLLDQAGMGKTVVLRDVLCALDEEGVAVLAVKADNQLTGVTSAAQLQDRLDLPASVEQVIMRLVSFKPVVVLIDQVDALSLSMARDQRTLDVVLDLVARLRVLPNVRILLSCRQFDLHNDPKLNRIQIDAKFSLAPVADEQVKQVLEAVGVAHAGLLPATQKLLRVPLHLDLFVRALEGREPSAQGHNGVTSLQDLYGLLWQNVVLKPIPDGPQEADRVQAIMTLAACMEREQQTTAPNAVLLTPDTKHLFPAAQYLASEGILLPGRDQWSFLHQTFYDYVYAKQFVESGKRLSERLLQGEQGLSARPQLVQILTYLRGSNPTAYAREIQALFDAGDLRFHLRDLLLRWFGSLAQPTETEWAIVRRMLINPAKRPVILSGMAGNGDWFVYLKEQAIGDLLHQSDEVLDTQIIPYLASLLNVAQADVIRLLEPYAERGDQWTCRLHYVLQSIREWKSDEAVDLFEKQFHALSRRNSFSSDISYELKEIGKTHPHVVCRIARSLFDQALEGSLAVMMEMDGRPYSKTREVFAAINDHALFDAVEDVSKEQPALFIASFLPWLERVVTTLSHQTNGSIFFTQDTLADHWYMPESGHERHFVSLFVEALGALAKQDPAEFRRVAQRLSALPYETCQRLVARGYRAAPDIYAADALRFLLVDDRRLQLGDNDQYESCQLVKAVVPFLPDAQRTGLESFLFTYAPVWRTWPTKTTGVRWRGLETLYLLQSFGEEHLTPQSLKPFRELERKFPGLRVSEKPSTGGGGMVGSPIDATERLSDKAWLRAMGKYQGNVKHKTDFLKGGAQQLSHNLAAQVQRDPQRFYCLAMNRVPLDVDGNYVRAFINGLAEADCPAEWCYEVMRRFIAHRDQELKRTIAWALQKRTKDKLPDDVLDWLEQEVRGPMGAEETTWLEEHAQAESKGPRGGFDEPYHRCLNSDRGSALLTLIEALDEYGTDAAKARLWSLIEFAASDLSVPVLAGAVRSLLYVMDDDQERAVTLFERLMDGHSELLDAQPTSQILYHGIYRFPDRVKPFIIATMNDCSERQQGQGAEFACVLATRQNDQALTDALLNGPMIWRRGAAHVYARSIVTTFEATCVAGLTRLCDDEEAEVRRAVGDVFRHLRDEHIVTLRPFIETFVSSRALYDGFRHATDYLSDRALLDPEWSLSIAARILGNEKPESRTWFGGAENLVRLILRVYTAPESNATLREKAMNLFDRFMQRYTGETQMVLHEWDQR